jgi:endonuclease/exonuclease/phosphatase family metal-dependent hydrolase
MDRAALGIACPDVLRVYYLQFAMSSDGSTPPVTVSCRDNTFTEFIDHLVVDRRVVPWVDRTSFRHLTYRQADKGDWARLSDHCPVLVELWIRP